MEKTKPEDYEKYGYLMDRDILKNFNSNRDSKGAGQYGDTQIRFKKDRVVTTFTMTDSLDAREDGRLLIPSLTTDPKLSSFDETDRLFKEMSRGKTMTKSATDFTQNYANGYIELQYHGRLDASAIESIFIPEKEFQQINKANLKAFKDKYGFKVFTEENDKLKEMF
jgi:hypothetical protein